VSFFAICPFNKLGCKVPKNGMNFNQPMPIVCGLDSSRFSGQLSKHNKACPGATLQITFLACKEHMLSGALNIVIASQVWARGIAKKDIPLFLRCIASRQKSIQQKKTPPCPFAFSSLGGSEHNRNLINTPNPRTTNTSRAKSWHQGSLASYPGPDNPYPGGKPLRSPSAPQLRDLPKQGMRLPSNQWP